MKTSKILITSLLILFTWTANVLAQDYFAATDEQVVLSTNATVKEEESSSIIYMVVGIAIGFATSSVGFIYYRKRRTGTEYDRKSSLGTPVNIRHEDQLVNKNRTVDSPEIEKHGNQFM